MHLIQLLSVSDTFTAGEIPVGRYHVVGLKVLPRFRSAGLAVRAPVRPTRRWPRREQTEQAVAAVSLQGKVGVEPAGFSAPVSDPTVPAGELETAVKPSMPERGPGVELERPSWWRRGMVWLARRFDRSRNPFGGSGIRIARTTRPRQGTLRLDAVQVVCHDLKDSDFELVPAVRPGAVLTRPEGRGFAVSGGGGRPVEPPGEARAGGGGL